MSSGGQNRESALSGTLDATGYPPSVPLFLVRVREARAGATATAGRLRAEQEGRGASRYPRAGGFMGLLLGLLCKPPPRPLKDYAGKGGGSLRTLCLWAPSSPAHWQQSPRPPCTARDPVTLWTRCDGLLGVTRQRPGDNFPRPSEFPENRILSIGPLGVTVGERGPKFRREGANISTIG